MAHNVGGIKNMLQKLQEMEEECNLNSVTCPDKDRRFWARKARRFQWFKEIIEADLENELGEKS